MAKKKNNNTGVRRRFHGFRFLTLFMAIAVGFELVGGAVALYGLNAWLKGKPGHLYSELHPVKKTVK